MRILIIALLVTVNATAFAQHPVKLKIIHWNDFHAQNTPMTKWNASNEKTSIGGFAYFKAVIDSLKQVAAINHEACMTLDAGDNFQGTAISGFTRGASQIKLMNILHPDAVTLGNHEFDYGWTNIDSLIRYKATFAVTNSNILLPNGKTFAQPYIIKQEGELHVAIIGLTTDDLVNLSLPANRQGLTITTCKDALKKYLPEIRKQKPDLIIVLSHIGVDADRELAKQFPEVNIFVGGHSHTPLQKPLKENHSVIVQAGSRGQYVGELELNIDTDGDSLLSYSGKLIETENSRIAPDPTIVQQIDLMEVPIRAKLSETIGILKKDWKNHEFGKSNLAAFEAMAFREATGSDIGVINYGGIRKPLSAGPITMNDIYEINPFGNELVSFTLTGAEIRSSLEWMMSDKGHEACEFYGITCTVDTLKKEGERISDILFAGKKIDAKKKYSVTTNIFVGTHLNANFGLNEDTHPFSHAGLTDRDVIIDAIKKRKEISGESEEWMKGL